MNDSPLTMAEKAERAKAWLKERGLYALDQKSKPPNVYQLPRVLVRGPDEPEAA